MKDKPKPKPETQFAPVFLALQRAERALLEGSEELAVALLQRARLQPENSAEFWLSCGKLSEALGRPQDALSDYGKALEKDATMAFLWLRRARILAEAGQIAQAKKEAGKALLAGATEEEVRKTLGPVLFPLAPPPEPGPSDIDQAFYQSRGRKRALERFLELFKGRPGAYARQWFDSKEGKGGYFPVLEPLTVDVLEAHLQGKITVGIYLLDSHSMVHFGLLDLDLGKEAISKAKEDLAFNRQLAQGMRDLMTKVQKVSAGFGLPVAFEKSGYKGVHAWFFFDGPTPAWAARSLLLALEDAVSPPPQGINIEVFPKQVTLSGKGYGNLVKLPLGIHRVTGKRSIFLEVTGREIEDSLQHVLRLERISSSLVLSLAQTLTAGPRGQVLPLRGREKLERHKQPEPAPEESVRPQKGPIRPESARAYGRILERCAMIRYLVRKAREFKHLSFDERKIVLGTLGHLPDGPFLVHHVISRCADYDPQITGHFISRMPRAPLGCRTIRRKLFYLSQTHCSCSFGLQGKDYATPLLHLQVEENSGCILPT